MGKLLCDSTASSPVIPWRDPTTTPTVDLVNQTPVVAGAATPPWDDVSGLDEQPKRHLTKLQSRGVLWKHPVDKNRSLVFRLSHGGEVESDGNCLFTASRKAMGSSSSARELRRTVRRFLEDLGSVSNQERDLVESVVRNMYSPDLKLGWGIHVVQEVKLLAKKEER